jgi:hypothetical protein
MFLKVVERRRVKLDRLLNFEGLVGFLGRAVLLLGFFYPGGELGHVKLIFGQKLVKIDIRVPLFEVSYAFGTFVFLVQHVLDVGRVLFLEENGVLV